MDRGTSIYRMTRKSCLPAAERKPVMPAVDKPFGALRQQRDTIVQHMASLFQ